MGWQRGSEPRDAVPASCSIAAVLQRLGAVLLILPVVAHAHAGALDASGCHTNGKTAS
jgi:hypothetical protein